MNWAHLGERVQGQWKLLTGQARERWGCLVRSDAHMLSGQRSRQAGRLMVRNAQAHGAIDRQLAAIDRKLRAETSRRRAVPK
jgi:uncharacterized protein YjbJ (UPF0337 family)